MSKFLKNEFIESSKNYLIVLIGGLITTCLLWFSGFSSAEVAIESGYNYNIGWEGILALFALLLAAAIFVVYIISIVNNFKDDLFTNKAYLKFTLPISRRKYLFTKVLNTVIWNIIFIVLIGGLNVFFISKYMIRFEGLSLLHSLEEIGLLNTRFILLSIFIFTINILYSIVFLYFCISLTKMLFKNSKNGNIWFFVYLIISIGLSILNFVGMRYFPHTLQYFPSTGTIRIVDFSDIFIDGNIAIWNYSMFTHIFNIIFTIVLYYITAYILEKKLDF